MAVGSAPLCRTRGRAGAEGQASAGRVAFAAEARTAEQHLATPIGEHVAATSAISKPAERARGMCGKPAESSTGAHRMRIRTLSNLDNRRQRGDCSGDDRDRTGNLLVANQASNRTQVLFAYGLDAFCCPWWFPGFLKISRVFARFAVVLVPRQ